MIGDKFERFERIAEEGYLIPGASGGLVLRPGDTLILSFPDRLTDAEFQKLSADLKEGMPGVKIAVIDGGPQMAAYRPKDESNA